MARSDWAVKVEADDDPAFIYVPRDPEDPEQGMMKVRRPSSNDDAVPLRWAERILQREEDKT